MSTQVSGNRTDVLVPPAEIFKAYDIRGIVGQSFTPEIVESIGHAIGFFFFFFFFFFGAPPL